MRGLIAELASARYPVTIVDMEAGLEHLARAGGTLRHVDQLLIITEVDRKALETARRTHRIAQELGIPRIVLVGNKLRDASECAELGQFSVETQIPLLAALAFDEAARQADRRGIALYDFAPEGATICHLKEVAADLENQFDLTPPA